MRRVFNLKASVIFHSLEKRVHIFFVRDFRQRLTHQLDRSRIISGGMRNQVASDRPMICPFMSNKAVPV